MHGTNTLKTVLLLGLLSGVLLVGGQAFAGRNGLYIGLALAVVMNFAGYFFSDKIALASYSAQPVSESENPEVYRRVGPLVRNLTQRMGLPMPKLWLIPEDSPNAFATGRNPAHASVAFTVGVLQLMDDRELEAVVAHELGHVLHRDILISSVAATLAAAIISSARLAFFFGGSRRDDDDRGGALGGILMIVLAPLRGHADSDGDLAHARIRRRCRVGEIYRHAVQHDLGADQTGKLVAAHSHGRVAGHRAHVHHQAVRRVLAGAALLDPSFDRRPHRASSGHAVTVIEVRVNRKAADRVASGHPWIFASDVVSAEGASSGIAVKVVDPRGRALGVAHYSSSSQISLRLLVRAASRKSIAVFSWTESPPPPVTARASCATPTPIAWCTPKATCSLP